MSGISWEDRAVYFRVRSGRFGETATLRGDLINGIFENGSKGDEQIAGTQPSFTCDSDDVPTDLAHKEEITISEVVYLIAEVLDDGTGTAHLLLELKG